MKKPLKQLIAQRVAEVLEQKGWRQQDLVEASGLTKAYVSQIMHGTLNLTLETIEVLEKALKVPIVKIPL